MSNMLKEIFGDNKPSWTIEENTSKEDKERILSQFKIVCSTCSSHNTELNIYNDFCSGSEYTGAYGDAGIVIKCKDCGSAITIETVDY